MINANGYVILYRPRHAAAFKNGWALEHRMNWLDAGLDIPADHVLHHLNGDKTDNRIENLECISRAVHSLYHYGPLREHVRVSGAWNRGMGAFVQLVCALCGNAFQRLRREADRQARLGRKTVCGRQCHSAHMNAIQRRARGEAVSQ